MKNHRKPIWYASIYGRIYWGNSINDIFRQFLTKNMVLHAGTKCYFYKLKGNVRTNERWIIPKITISIRGKHFTIGDKKYERIPPKYYEVIPRYD